MSDEQYNGWTGHGTKASAYATWRINMELCEDYCDELEEGGETFPDTYALAQTLKEYVENRVCEENYHGEKITTQYAMAFIDDVNWQEIAEHWAEELIATDEEDE